ncbi:MAG: hypothetical protein AAGA58_12365 [Verrucomicrobiota bacterium]
MVTHQSPAFRAQFAALALTLVTSATLLPQRAEAFTYSLDDGTVTGSLSIGVGTEGYMLNAFQVVPGQTIVTAAEFAFGVHDGASFDIVLFRDGNNDGDPTDATLVSQDTVAKPASGATGVFTSFAFSTPGTFTAGDWFFVGAFEPTNTTLTINYDAAGGLSSWVSFPGAAFPSAGLDTSPNLGFPNDFMIRATAIPEPTTALLGLVALPLALRRRRK